MTRNLLSLGLALNALGFVIGSAAADIREFESGRVDAEKLLLDAATLVGEGTFPVAGLYHGGGWAGGDNVGDISPVLAPLTAAGLACVAINYRLAPPHRAPRPG